MVYALPPLLPVSMGLSARFHRPFMVRAWSIIEASMLCICFHGFHRGVCASLAPMVLPWCMRFHYFHDAYMERFMTLS